MELSCPLCRADNVRILEVIRTERIQDEFLRAFSVHIQQRLPPSFSYLYCYRCSLRFFSPMMAGDEALYEQLQIHPWYYQDDKSEYRYACRHVGKCDRVLEVGAGKAAWARMLAGRRVDYHGLEYNQLAIDTAARAGVQLLRESVDAHVVRCGAIYDVVASFQVLEHVADPWAFVSGCVGALRPGGTLILAVPDRQGIFGVVTDSVLAYPPHHLSHWSRDVMNNLAGIFSLMVIDIQRLPLDPIHEGQAKLRYRNLLLRRLLGIRRGGLDLTPDSVWWGRIARASLKLIPGTLGRLGGHTICACYRKPL